MKASMNIKMDEEIRDQAKALLGSMGLSFERKLFRFLLRQSRTKKQRMK